MGKKLEARFLTGPTMGHVWRMALSGTAGITFVFLVDVVNLFWISQIGDTSLVAAMGFAFAIQFFSVSFGIGFMIATMALVSRSIGEGRIGLAKEQAVSCMLMSVFLQCFIAIVFILFIDELVALNGASGQTASLTSRYLLISLFSLPVMAIGMTGSAILRANGDAVRAMTVTLASGAVCMFTDPILIYWLDLRLDGAAISVWIFRFVMALVALYYLTRSYNLLARPSINSIRQTVKPFLNLAIPAIFTQLSIPFGNFVLTAVMAGFGDSAVAAWAVINRLTAFSFGGIFSLSTSIGGIFGQNYGALKYSRIKTTFRDSLMFCFLYTLIIWAILAISSIKISELFMLDNEGTSLVRIFTQIGIAGFFFTGMSLVTTAAFNNLGKPFWGTAINWFREGVITLPVAIFFSSVFFAPGVIFAQAFVACITGSFSVVLGFWFISRLKVDRLS